MSAIKSTTENATTENALREMSEMMSAFAFNDVSRRQLDEDLNNICAKYNHPFGSVTKTRKGDFLGGGYNGGVQMEYYDKIKYQACRFCDASLEKLKL